MALPTAQFLPSDTEFRLPAWDKIDFCCSEALSLWYFCLSSHRKLVHHPGQKELIRLGPAPGRSGRQWLSGEAAPGPCRGRHTSGVKRETRCSQEPVRGRAPQVSPARPPSKDGPPSSWQSYSWCLGIISPEQRFSIRGDLVTGCWGEGLHPAGRGQGCFPTPYSVGTTPTTKNTLPQMSGVPRVRTWAVGAGAGLGP